ncbi:MAG: hypothetical protein H8D97_01050, partial [Proteobacteria bacterium]|nr:hypothetical protein [Pseudomonadota bacterium]
MHNKLVLECTNSLIEEGMKEAYAACRDNKKKFKTDGVIEKVACGVGKLVRRKNLFNARRKFKNEKESRIIKGKGNQELH